MDYYDRIEAYLNKTLSEDENNAFEKAMENDPELRAAVENHDVAMDVVSAIIEGELREIIDIEEKAIENGKLRIENVENNEVGKEKRAGRMRRLDWMRWAGAAVVVLVVGWWGLGENANDKLLSETDKIHHKNARPGSLRGGNDTGDVKDSITSTFRRGRFEQSLELSKKLENKNPSQFTHYYIAQNLFKLRRHDQCIETIRSKPQYLDEHLQIILVMSLLLVDEKSEAIEEYRAHELNIPELEILLQN